MSNKTNDIMLLCFEVAELALVVNILSAHLMLLPRHTGLVDILKADYSARFREIKSISCCFKTWTVLFTLHCNVVQYSPHITFTMTYAQ